VFDVAVNGTTVYPHLDVFVAAGGLYKTFDLTVPATVANGQLSVKLTAITGHPKINAIEIQ
jgi:hypothetical protein